MKKIISNVRYDFIARRVYKISKDLSLKEYPINLKATLKKFEKLGIDIQYDEYKNYAAYKKMSLKQTKEFFKSPDGATAYINAINMFIIFINTNDLTIGRQTWTIAHELGHIVLGHYKTMETIILQRRGISKNQYDILEKEADWFARSFICNPYVLGLCHILDPNIIMNVCNISLQAARNRLKDIQIIKSQNTIYNSSDLRLTYLFADFIFRRHCLRCGHYFSNSDAAYCPICGRDNLIWGMGKMIYNDGIEVDENGKARACPICKNEEIHTDAKYCKICGTNIVNACTNLAEYDSDGFCTNNVNACGKSADGNAAFCIYCGAATTFNSSGLLKTWEERKKILLSENLDNTQYQSINTGLYPIDDGIEDDELPF